MSPRAEFSKKTKLAAFTRSCGHCFNCGIRLLGGNIEYHHDKECTFGGNPNLENCVVLCKNCHGAITKERAAVIAKSNRQRAAHIGARRKRQSFLTNKNGPFRKKLNGTVERRT